MPNSRLELQIDDLEHAVRAEALLDRWGGHRGTINKRIRFNDHDWITVPEIRAVPTGIRPGGWVISDRIDHSVGLEMLVRLGDEVQQDQPVLRVFADRSSVDNVRSRLEAAITVQDNPLPTAAVVVERVGTSAESNAD